MTKVNFLILTFNEAGIQIIDGDRGYAYPKSSDFMESGYCLFLTAQNVTSDGFKFNEGQFVSEKKHNELRNGTLQRQDIVLTSRGTVGNVALYDDRIPYDVLRINSGMLILRNSGKSFETDYLYALLRSPLFKKQIRSLSFGSAQPQITVQVTNSFEFPCPSKPEQKKIAEILSSWDRALETLDKLIDAKTQLKKGLMQKLLTGKVRFKEFKEHWKDYEYDDLFETVSAKKNQVAKEKYMETGKYPVVDQGQSRVVGYTNEERVFRNVPVIVFGDHTRIIKWIDFPFVVGADGTQLLKTKSVCDLKYGFYLLSNLRLPNLGYSRHFKVVKESTFCISSNLREQTKIAKIFSAIDCELNALSEMRESLKKQKKGLMQKLLTGKIRVKI